MTEPRIVVTSGDPATGVVGIEQAPHEPCPTCHGSGNVSIFSTSTVGLRGCSDCRASGRGRVPVSLPATVEVAKLCPKCRGTGRGFDWLLRVVPCRKCHGTRFVVLGTATLEGVWEYDECIPWPEPPDPDTDAIVSPDRGGTGLLWMPRHLYDALAPGGLVAHLTDWQPA